VAKEIETTPPAGVSGTDAAASALLATTAGANVGPVGLAAGGIPLLRTPARNRVLSSEYQQQLAVPAKPPASPGTVAARSGMAAITQANNEQQ
jgi:hypothetical protein